MISDRLAAQIRRLFTVEGWRRNTIARHLGIHHSTIDRALARAGLLEPRTLPRRPSILDPFVPFVRETLEQHPALLASVLYEMVRRRGYPGAEDHFRHRVAQLGLRLNRGSPPKYRAFSPPSTLDDEVQVARFSEVVRRCRAENLQPVDLEPPAEVG